MEQPSDSILAIRSRPQEDDHMDTVTPDHQNQFTPIEGTHASDAKPYQYRPLKEGEIRLLKLFMSTHEKSKTNDTISGEIIYVSITDLPQYEALSYCWGTEDSTESIIIDGDKSLPIKPNLAAGLRQLRQHDPQRSNNYRWFWIDAICINQEDIDERNQQIQLMCDIYTRCNQLIVWLGVADQDAHLVVSFFETMAGFQGNEEKLKVWLPEQLASAAFIQIYIAILKLLSSPWFGRAWIFQEYVLGAKDTAIIQYGEHKISQKAFIVTYANLVNEEYCDLDAWRQKTEVLKALHEDNWNVLQTRLTLRWSVVCSIPIIYDGIRSLKEDFPLLYCIEMIRQATSTDPRDKVYAILGMLGRASDNPVLHTDGLKIDYKASVEDVYSSVVKELIFRTKRLHVLFACGERGPLIHRTWTPDWSTTQLYIGFLAIPCGKFDVKALENPGNYLSSQQLDCEASISADMSTLTVAGLKWAAVKSVSPLLSNSMPEIGSQKLQEGMQDYGFSGHFLQHLEACWSTLQSHPRCLSEADAFKSLWRTLLVDVDSSIGLDWISHSTPDVQDILFETSTPIDIDTIHDLNAILHILYSLRPSPSSWNHPTLLSALEEEYTAWQRVFITEEGYIGKFFNENIQIGDVVCVLLGCPAPILLRPVEGGYFEVLGGVYMDGIMYGEAIDAMDRGEVEVRDFELI
ncbi:hypothetical protein VTL71DRAFT_15114 [Oculimacula yallundae]|uniref:Heterokaryon incompatibility domain-containing protein n=1 Tax=Oculimacula yallundae TaxID=86028 RepID=A0ABR4CHQ1_9HELO